MGEPWNQGMDENLFGLTPPEEVRNFRRINRVLMRFMQGIR